MRGGGGGGGRAFSSAKTCFSSSKKRSCPHVLRKRVVAMSRRAYSIHPWLFLLRANNTQLFLFEFVVFFFFFEGRNCSVEHSMDVA